MPRHQTPPAEPVHAPLDKKALAAKGQALNELAVIDNEAELRTLELARKLGYDGPLDPDVIERGVVHQMRRTVEACLETGRMMLVLKERVGHGNFVERIQRLGVAPRGAQKFMQAALKFSNAPSTAHLANAIGNQTKLLELLVLDQEQIDELGTEGSVLGIELDEIASLSVSELRARLRDAKQTEGAKDKILAKRDQKIASLEEKLERPYKPRPESIARTADEAAMLKELNDAFTEAHLAAQRVVSIAGEVFDRFVDGEPLAAHARDCVDHVVKALASVAANYAIEIDLTIQEATMAPWVASQLSPAAIEAVTKHAAGKKAR